MKFFSNQNSSLLERDWSRFSVDAIFISTAVREFLSNLFSSLFPVVISGMSDLMEAAATAAAVYLNLNDFIVTYFVA